MSTLENAARPSTCRSVHTMSAGRNYDETNMARAKRQTAARPRPTDRAFETAAAQVATVPPVSAAMGRDGVMPWHNTRVA